jgi:hypothetical protein
MSLSDIYNPKEGYDSIELADLQGTFECVNPKSTPHCRSYDFTCTHATALDLTWITKPVEGLDSRWDVYHYIPVEYHRKERSNRHLPIFWPEITDLMKPYYVQAYVDALTVSARGTLEDHLAKLKGPQEDARCRTENNSC